MIWLSIGCFTHIYSPVGKFTTFKQLLALFAKMVAMKVVCKVENNDNLSGTDYFLLGIIAGYYYEQIKETS